MEVRHGWLFGAIATICILAVLSGIFFWGFSLSSGNYQREIARLIGDITTLKTVQEQEIKDLKANHQTEMTTLQGKANELDGKVTNLNNEMASLKTVQEQEIKDLKANHQTEMTTLQGKAYQDGETAGLREGKLAGCQEGWNACYRYYFPFYPPYPYYPPYVVVPSSGYGYPDRFTYYFDGYYRFILDFEGRVRLCVAGELKLEAWSFYYQRATYRTSAIYLSGYKEVRVECAEGRVYSLTWQRTDDP